MEMEVVGSMQTILSPVWFFVAALMALVIADIVGNDVKVASKWVWIGATVLLFPVGPILCML